MTTVETFLANLRHAIRRGDTVVIGGGQFTPAELAEVINNIEPVRRHSIWGRSFKVVASFPVGLAGEKAANAYMEAHPGSALLEITDDELILAHKGDSGIPG